MVEETRSEWVKRRLLHDPTLTPDEKMAKLLPVSRAFAQASNKIRQFNLPSSTDTVEEEDPFEGDELVTPSLNKWMKRMVRALGPPKMVATPGAVKGVTPARKRGTTPKRKPAIPPKPRPLEFGSDDDWTFPPPPPPLPPTPPPLTSPKTGPIERDPSPFPFHDEDFANQIKKLKKTPAVSEKAGAASDMRSILERAMKEKFDKSKGSDTDDDESFWSARRPLRNLRPLPHRKRWEEWEDSDEGP